MKVLLTTFLVSTLALGQAHQHAGQPPPSKTAPRLGFVETKDSSGVIDGDLLAHQQRLQDEGAAMHSMRDMHQAELTRDFIQDFNEAKECDRIVLLGNGDNKPDFAMQVEVTAHDAQGQKPLWHWILYNTRTKKAVSGATAESSKQAARNICAAVWSRVDPSRLKQLEGEGANRQK